MTGHTGWVRTLAFSRDGTLATGTIDGTARFWNTGFVSWVTAGCKLVNRNFSLDEWGQLASGLPYERTCPDLPACANAPQDSAGAQYPPPPPRASDDASALRSKGPVRPAPVE